MVKDLDDIVDERARDTVDPGERFRQSFLERFPQSQWPSYIDEIAIDLSADIGIGDTQLHTHNFPREVGPLYRLGVRAATGANSDISQVLEETVDSTSLGTIVYQLNQLRHEVEESDTGSESMPLRRNGVMIWRVSTLPT